MKDQKPGAEIILDFEDGVDAIEFMIEGFGFEDIALLRDAEDVPVQQSGGLRLVHSDVGNLDVQDFEFPESD